VSRVTPTPERCDRARRWLSLDLDGELSEFERSLLGAHLSRCESCRAFGAEITVFTGHMRAAPPEQLERPIVVPTRRRAYVSALPIAAAVAVVAAGFTVTFGAVRTHRPTRPIAPPAAGLVASVNPVDELRLERVRAAEPRAAPPPSHLRRSPRDDV
jgi:Putative zinc-finger